MNLVSRGVTLKPGLLQILLSALVAIVAVAGAAVSIVAPHTLPFHAYLTDVKDTAYGVAGLGLGKGVHLGLSNIADGLSKYGPKLAPIGSELGQGKVGQAVADAENELPTELLPSDDEEQTHGQPPDPSAVEALAGAVDEPLAPADTAAPEVAAEAPAVEPDPEPAAASAPKPQPVDPVILADAQRTIEQAQAAGQV